MTDALSPSTPEPRSPSGRRPIRSRPARLALVAAGLLCIGLAAVGVVVPLLPTTPFLLLAAACFVRGSDRMHRWLMDSRFLGDYLRRYHAGHPLEPRAQAATLLLLWGGLATSAILAVPARLWWVRVLLFGIGGAVTLHVLRLGKRREPPRPAP